MNTCKSIRCSNPTSGEMDFCAECNVAIPPSKQTGRTLAELYPQYYKNVEDLSEIDVYAVHQLFAINDPSGSIHHASKKLLLSGVRTGGKSAYKDVKEARDTLTRWLELNKDKA